MYKHTDIYLFYEQIYVTDWTMLGGGDTTNDDIFSELVFPN